MSLKALHSVAEETRRLAIAGSTLAPGDFRLEKLIAPLEKSGEKAPVFAKVAASVRAVVESDENGAGVALLDLGTLANAILYTQGSTVGDDEGEIEELPPAPVEQRSTQTSYRVIAPLIEALTSTGSGRLRLIEDAHERGVFADLRLVDPAIRALDDGYGEIAEFVAKKVVPGLGPGVLPLLREGFDPKGGRGDARRLEAMSAIDREGTRELCRDVLENGRKECKLAAIAGLAGSPDDVKHLMELAKDKSQDISSAAYAALARSPVRAGIEFVKQALAGAKSLVPFLPALRSADAGELTETVIADGQQLLAQIEAGKADAALYGRLEHVLNGLEYRTDEASLAFVRSCAKLAPRLNSPKREALHTVDYLIRCIDVIGDELAIRSLVDNCDKLEDCVGGMMRLTIPRSTPDETYDRFSAYLKKAKIKKLTPAQKVVLQALTWNFRGDDPIPWSPKWLDLMLKLDAREQILHLARPGHRELNKYLEAQAAKQLDQSIAAAMFRAEHPTAFEALGSLFQALAKKKANLRDWEIYPIAALIPAGQPDLWPKFEKLADGLPEQIGEKIRERLAELRADQAPSS